MTELPELAQLITIVESQTKAGDALDRITAAEALVADLDRLGDRVIGYFVEQARAEGHSWSDIGAHLGVSRQAAQQRYTPRWSSLTLADLAQAGALTQLTPRTRDCLQQAEGHARRLRHDAIGAEHILLAILENPDTLAVKALRETGADVDAIRTRLEAQLVPGTADSPAAIPVSPQGRRCFGAAVSQALELGHNYIGTEHLLLGLLGDKQSAASQILTEHGADLTASRAAVRELLSAYLRSKE
jgi:hypothetical protein